MEWSIKYCMSVKKAGLTNKNLEETRSEKDSWPKKIGIGKMVLLRITFYTHSLGRKSFHVGWEHCVFLWTFEVERANFLSQYGIILTLLSSFGMSLTWKEERSASVRTWLPSRAAIRLDKQKETNEPQFIVFFYILKNAKRISPNIIGKNKRTKNR